MKTQFVAALVLVILLYACGTPGAPAAPQPPAPTTAAEQLPVTAATMADKSPTAAMADTSAANPAATVEQPTAAHAPATLDSRFVGANTRFGLKLYKRLTQQDPGQNVFVSPASVSMALTVLYNG